MDKIIITEKIKLLVKICEQGVENYVIFKCKNTKPREGNEKWSNN
jgi:hypothetical protein